VETGEPPISRQNALDCTKSHIKFQIFSGVIPPGPCPLGALLSDPWERMEGQGGERKGREERGRKVR